MSELPEGWVEQPMEEVATVILGQSPPGTSYNSDGVGVPFLQGKAEFGELLPDIRKWTTAPKKMANAGDVLLSVRAPVGPTNLAPCDLSVGRGLAALRPGNGITNRYLLWALRESASRLAERATGTTFPAVSGKIVRSHVIRVAPLPEQQRIVAAIEEQFSRLDAAVGAIGSAATRLAQYRVSSATHYLSGPWPVHPLGDLASTASGGTPLRSRRENFGGGIPWIKSGELRDSVVTSSEETLTEEGLNNSSAKLFARGTLLVALYGATVGKLGLLNIDEAATNQAVCAIKPHDPEMVPYLWWVLRARRSWLLAQGKGGAQSNISQGVVKSVPVPVPPPEERRRIVSQIQQSDSVVEVLMREAKLASRRVDTCRVAILRDAFSGRLASPAVSNISRGGSSGE